MSDYDELSNLGIRTERVIWIPGAACSRDGFSEDFKDFCENLPEREEDRLYRDLPLLARFAAEENLPEPEDVADALARVDGFFVQGACPVRQYLPGDVFMSGWGYYRTQWFYVTAIAEATPKLSAWADECEALDRAEQKATAA